MIEPKWRRTTLGVAISGLVFFFGLAILVAIVMWDSSCLATANTELDMAAEHAGQAVAVRAGLSQNGQLFSRTVSANELQPIHHALAAASDQLSQTLRPFAAFLPLTPAYEDVFTSFTELRATLEAPPGQLAPNPNQLVSQVEGAQALFQQYYSNALHQALNILLVFAMIGIAGCVGGAWLLVLRHQRLQHATKAQHIMTNIGQAIAQADSLEELLALIHSELQTLFDARNFFVALYDSTSGHYSFPYYVDEQDTDFAPQPLKQSRTDYVRETGQPLLCNRNQRAGFEIRPGIVAIGPESPSWMGVPLRTTRGLTGVVCVQSYSLQTRYTPDNLALLDLVANSIALAIERKQSEDALRRSEQNYRSFVEQSEDGIWCIACDPPVPTTLPVEQQIKLALESGWVVDCNNSYAWRFGYSNAASLIGQPATVIYPPENLRAHKQIRAFITSGYRLYEYEITIQRSHYGEILTQNNVVGLVDDGKLSIIWGIQRDITDQRINQRALAESERMYSTLVRNLPGVVFRCGSDENLTLEYISEAAYEVTGYPGTEMIDEKVRSFNSLVDPRYLAQRKERMWQAIHNRQPYEIIYPIICAGGERKWLREFGRAEYDAQGDFLSLEGVIFDISDQKHAEEDQQLLATAVEHAAEAVMITDPDGFIQYVNPAFERVTQYSRVEVIGKSSRLLNSGKHDNEYFRQMWMTIIDGRVWHGRLISRRMDSTLLEEEAAISPVFDASGKIINYVAVKRDVTRESELQARIQQAQKMESLAVLAGGIAHDFNNLLMGILGNASLAMLEVPSNSIIAPYIRDIETAGQRAAELSQQMLAYSGKGHFTMQVMDISQLVKEMAHLLEVAIPKDIELQYNLTTNLPPVEGDATQLRQVVMNLITNARDAVGNRPGRITLRTGVLQCDSDYLASLYPYTTLASGAYCFLEVVDNGCGMDRETQQRIFDPFFSTKATGHGLGLAAVLGIVRGHHGALRVYSEPGAGTTFRVYIPVTTPGLRQAEALTSTADEWRGEGTILVVDDESTVRLVADRILRRYGFTVLTADNGRTAVDLFTEHADEISAVLLDLTMPQLSGEEACREILAVRSDAKVILSSGFTESETVEAFQDLKLAGFIQKPYRAQDLVSKLRQVLG
jgi:PAS domain S-box-containing protein